MRLEAGMRRSNDGYLRPQPAGLPGVAQMCDIMGSLGMPAFEDHLLQSVSSQISCSHLTAFSFAEDVRPTQILAVNMGRPEIARNVGERYLERYWHLDPVKHPGAGEQSVTSLLVDEIDDSDYRRDCYEAVDLIERLSVVHAAAHQCIRLSFYRSRGQGQFSDGERTLIEGWSAFLIAAILKHRSLAQPKGTDGHIMLADRLRQMAPQLSPRETDVCIDIVLGHTSESIAFKRDLSVNTVLSHRRNAYAKLLISSQSELSRLVLASGGIGMLHS